MRLAELLRLTALGIALLCWLDPPVIVTPLPPVVVDAAIVRSPRDQRPVGNDDATPVGVAAERIAAALAEAIGPAGRVRVHEVAPGDVLPCDALQPCAIITEGAAIGVPEDRRGPLGIIAVGQALAPNVDVRELVVPPAHLHGQATAAVVLAGGGVAGRTSQIRIFDGAAVVGEQRYTWDADGEREISVPWWPIAGGTRTLHARVTTEGVDERTTADDELAAAADVVSAPWPVAIFERRPSWSATFIRRALEDDPRFDVAVRTDVAPGITASTSPTGTFDDLDHVRVVVVGAPDALTNEDVTRLERYVRQRGGAVVLVPDRRLSGPVNRLLHHRWRERLEEAPSAAGPLRASEWLLATDVSPLDLVWAQAGEDATVVATPAGAGIVLVSGALDAWRHRGTDGAYESFWRATVARLALGVGPVVDIDVLGADPDRPGEATARVVVHTAREVAAWEVVVARECDDGGSTAVRLWPDNAAGAFTGRVPIGGRTGCRLSVAVPALGEQTWVRLPDMSMVRASLRWSQAQMEALVARTGGMVVRGANVQPLVQTWLEARSGEPRPEPRHPMRSWWWLLPLVGSLAGEWWLRRRAGLR